MAKDKKNAAPAAKTEEQKAQVNNGQETTVENIEEQIKSANKMEEDIVKAAEEQIKKEKDDKKKQEMKLAILEATYINNRELLELRKRRKEANATKEALAATKENLDALKGGKLTPREYEKALSEVAKKKAEEFQKIDKNHQELVKELQDNFPNYYSLEWEYERWSRTGHAPRFTW